MNHQVQLDEIVRMFKEEMGDTLTGIYLHGSMAMNCFHPSSSDIDLLITVGAPQAHETYKRIAQRLILAEEKLAAANGIELSVVLDRNFEHFTHPAPFEFHYSAFHRERYRTDDNYLCGGFGDPDLAAHFMVAYHRGVALYGRPFHERFNPIDEKYYLNAIKGDIENAAEEIAGNPVYYVLNLCRVLFYREEGGVTSKKEGGEWGLSHLPAPYAEIVEQCLDKYKGKRSDVDLDAGKLKDFAEFMLDRMGMK